VNFLFDIGRYFKFRKKSNIKKDWRAVIKENQHKTLMVIGVFIAIYLALGFLIDLFINGAFVANNFNAVFINLLTFTLMPYATIILTVVAIICLLITYGYYDQVMLLGTEYYEITPKSARNLTEQQLYNVMEELKIASGMRYMPKIYLIAANYMNAFASGYSEKSAMVAITRGLIEKLTREELQAVMAHELSHIRNADIKLTLTASVLSNLILIILDVLFYSIIFDKDNNRKNNNAALLILLAARYLLPLITALLFLFLSRTREYMADAGCVELTRDNHPLARALLKIEHDYQTNADSYEAEYGHAKHEEVRRAAYIFDPFATNIQSVKSITSIFSTHPALLDRLKALGFSSKNL